MKKTKLNLPQIFKRKKTGKIKVKVDWGEVLHVAFNTLLPFALVLLVNLELAALAVLVAVFSKWRMFAVRPNHLPANIRANATDLIVKLSLLSFIIRFDELALQLIIAASYSVWLLLIKPQTTSIWVALQAAISQIIGITALFWFSQSIPEVLLLFAVWAIVYTTTFHYLSDFDDKNSRLYAKIWALVAVQLAWIFYRWNLVYFGFIPQYGLMQLALSYIGAEVYRAKALDKLTPRQIRSSVVTLLIVVIVIIFSADWSGTIVI